MARTRSPVALAHPQPAAAPERPAVLRVWLPLAWLGAASVLVLAGPHSGTGLRAFAVVGLVVAGTGAMRALRAPARATEADRHASNQPSMWHSMRKIRAQTRAEKRHDALSSLREINPNAATKVQRALDLIDGPLHKHLDDADLAATGKAIRRSLRSLDTLRGTRISTEAAATTLAQQLEYQGVAPDTDAQWQAATSAARALAQRSDQTVTELRTGAEQIIAAAGQIQKREAEQKATQALAAARNAAEDATDLALEAQAQDEGLASSRAALTDTIDGLRARLVALDELEDLSDKIAPLRNQLPGQTT